MLRLQGARMQGASSPLTDWINSDVKTANTVSIIMIVFAAWAGIEAISNVAGIAIPPETGMATNIDPDDTQRTNNGVIVGLGAVLGTLGLVIQSLIPRGEEEQDETLGPVFDEDLVKLTKWLCSRGTTTAQFFEWADTDNSGSIDMVEFANALRAAEIANLPPWEIDELVKLMDINSDGRINLPELDIALLNIRNALGIEFIPYVEEEKPEEAVEEETNDSETEEVADESEEQAEEAVEEETKDSETEEVADESEEQAEEAVEEETNDSETEEVAADDAEGAVEVTPDSTDDSESDEESQEVEAEAEPSEEVDPEEEAVDDVTESTDDSTESDEEPEEAESSEDGESAVDDSEETADEEETEVEESDEESETGEEGADEAESDEAVEEGEDSEEEAEEEETTEEVVEEAPKKKKKF